MTLIATRSLYNRLEYGKVAAGQTFTAPDHVARELIDRGYAVSQTYQTKVIVAGQPIQYAVKEGTAAAPFRHGAGVDPEPPALVAVRAAVRAVSDVQAAGNPGSVERGKHHGSAGGK